MVLPSNNPMFESLRTVPLPPKEENLQGLFKCPLCYQAGAYRSQILLIHKGRGIRRINPFDIVAIRAKDKYVCIYLSDGEEVWDHSRVHSSLKHFEAMYDWMVRVDRDWLVPLEHLERIRELRVSKDLSFRIPGVPVPITTSRRFRSKYAQLTNVTTSTLKAQHSSTHLTKALQPEPRQLSLIDKFVLILNREASLKTDRNRAQELNEIAKFLSSIKESHDGSTEAS